MSYAIAASRKSLRELLGREPYVLGEGLEKDLSTVTSQARQVLQHYYDSTTITRQNQIIEEAFAGLANDWLSATKFESSLSKATAHPAYQAIINLGPQALPLLLRELQQRPNFWFAALREITGVNPVRERDKGNIEKMRQAWLRWAKEQRISW